MTIAIGCLGKLLLLLEYNTSLIVSESYTRPPFFYKIHKVENWSPVTSFNGVEGGNHHKDVRILLNMILPIHFRSTNIIVISYHHYCHDTFSLLKLIISPLHRLQVVHQSSCPPWVKISEFCHLMSSSMAFCVDYHYRNCVHSSCVHSFPHCRRRC